MTDNLPQDLVDKLTHFYMPGTIIAEFKSFKELNETIDLGFGLEIAENYSKSDTRVNVVTSHSGVLKFRKPNQIFIESMSKIYIPSEGDRIIGKVVKKAGDYYLIDFGGSCYANLSYLHFQDATKNNRPNVKVNDVVYCQVSLAEPGVELEVTCVDSLGKSAGMGVIDNSEDSIIKVDLPTARKLSNAQLFPLLKKIGTGILPNEVIIGSNGWIWVCARSSREFVTLVNCITMSQHLDASHIKDLIKTIRSGMFFSVN